MNKKLKSVTILGVELGQEHFPNLLDWANKNQEGLKVQLQSIADKWHEGNLTSAAIALEVDLAHMS